MNEAEEESVRDHAKYAIARIADRADLFEGDESRIARWTLDRQRAVNIIEKYNITEDMAYNYYWKYRGYI